MSLYIDRIRVTEATVNDAEAMGSVLLSTAPVAHELPGQSDQNDLVLAHFKRKAAKLATEIETGQGRYWLAKNIDTEVVGMGGFNPKKEQLHSLYVLTKGHGLGKLLFDHITSQPEIPPNYSAWIADFNLGSFAFFERQGLVRTGHTDNWPLKEGTSYKITIHQVAPSGTEPTLATVD